MRILLWTQYDTSSLGGVEVFTRVLAAGLLRAGHHVRLLVERAGTNACDENQDEALPVHLLPFHEALATRSPALIGDVLDQVSALKRRFAPDVVHLNATEAMTDFVGPLDEDGVADTMAQAFCIVVPSRFDEPFGMVAAEGSLAGLPVVVADRGGLPEIVQHDKTGLVFASDEVSALVQALRQLLRDPHRAAQFGIDGSARALARFTTDITAERYDALFSRVLGQGPVLDQMR